MVPGVFQEIQLHLCQTGNAGTTSRMTPRQPSRAKLDLPVPLSVKRHVDNQPFGRFQLPDKPLGFIEKDNGSTPVLSRRIGVGNGRFIIEPDMDTPALKTPVKLPVGYLQINGCLLLLPLPDGQRGR